MSYENKEYILQFFEGVHEEENRAELLEVYRKAKAFDAYHSIISKHIEQQYSHNKHNMVKRFVKIHDEYESGEYDAKK